ncbi:MAG: hypothetical protein IJ945_04430 [Oscillospiraceae bacterium]|nr:hypothetical protein [Oscillospiraceae bacterium]
MLIGGDYYYARSSGEILTNTRYWVTKTNDVLPAAYYEFGEDGKMLNPPTVDPDDPEIPDKPVWPDRPEDDSDKEDVEKDEDEVNPKTGAPANGFSLLGAVAVVAACAAATKKFRK